MRTVVLAGALDTKAAEFAWVKSLVEAQGLRALVIDVGILGEPGFAPDISREAVASAAGSDLESLRRVRRRGEALEVMGRGLAVIARRLYDEGALDGILGMGGSGGTTVATAGMRALPLGLPKLMVSTVASGDTRAFVGPADIVMMPSIVDVAGINRISAKIYANAAAAIAGMVRGEAPPIADERPLIAASMFGNTTPCVDHARRLIEKHGFEVLVFHATGIGGQTMESLISEGYIVGCLDITTTELADEVCGGGASAGPERCLAASRAGIPAVIAPGCVDMANFGALESLPEKVRERNVYQWAPTATLLRTNIEENRRIGEMIAAAANAASAPVAIILPLKGVSMLDSEGGAFWDPAADAACFDAIKSGLRKDIPVIELACNINDPPFAGAAAGALLNLMRQSESDSATKL
ncbi:MAG: Tm-1-like ATP-binding domain-containing protein [Chloroflexota bacterium]|nr:Tm-1-like ATP-binding domain-containing protein [Chloroflexota bacterium]